MKLTISLLIFALFFTSCATNKAGQKPLWIDDPYALHDKNIYVAAAGYGANIEEAKSDAVFNLTGIFGSSIDDTGTDGEHVIIIENAIDNLIGAEIAEIWDDKNGECYALAVINKKNAHDTYTTIISGNLKKIDSLVTIPDNERNTIDSVSRFLQAAAIMDTTEKYFYIISLTGEKEEFYNYKRLKSSGDYLAEANNIKRTIPIRASVQNDDRAGRIKSAFELALSKSGFRTIASTYRYTLEAVINKIDNHQNKDRLFYAVEARLTDTTAKKVIFQYTLNDDFEIQDSVIETEYTAMEAMEEKITDDFYAKFENYLT
jgi:hypothetical protein